jgi:hypothetical protein
LWKGKKRDFPELLIAHCAHEPSHLTQKLVDENENEDEDEVQGQGGRRGATEPREDAGKKMSNFRNQRE